MKSLRTQRKLNLFVLMEFLRKMIASLMINQNFLWQDFQKFNKRIEIWKTVKSFQNAETMSLCIYLNQINHRQTDRQALRTLLHRHLVSHHCVLWQRARTSSVSDIVGTLAIQRRVHST